MKKMKKFLISFFVLLSLTALPVFADESDDAAVQDYYEQLSSETQSIDSQLEAAAEQMFEQYFSGATMDDVEYYKDNTIGVLQDAMENYGTYLENDTLGDYIGIKGSNAEATKNGYSVLLKAEYKNVYLDVTVEWKTISGQLTPTAISFVTEEKAEKTMADKMGNAALNTLIGLATVFVILIIISFIISRFKLIPELEKKLSKKKEEEKAVSSAVENVTAQIEQKEELVDDTELVAVITAAICAAGNVSSDGFVVRSIRKSKRK